LCAPTLEANPKHEASEAVRAKLADLAEEVHTLQADVDILLHHRRIVPWESDRHNEAPDSA
jgi:hypothetical protein